MSDMIHHTSTIWHFDGLLHWCFLLSVVGFFMGMVWMYWRVLLPLRRLARQVSAMGDNELPTFDAPLRGIREVEQLRRALQHMSGQVATARQREQTYRTALTESQEHERLRIAREIHDDTIQALVLVSHSIERAAQAVHSGQNAVVAQLESGRSQLLAAIDCLRRLISNLRPTALDELGLVVALEMLCEQHRSLRFCVKGEVYSLEHPVELALFRAAQEAIRNAERHAHAHCITVTLNYARSVVLLEVSDDGTGFTIPHQLQEFAAHGHFGLMGMRERIDHLGGTLQLKSAPGDGSIITIRLPVVRCDADARHPLVIPVGAFRQSVSGKQRLLRPM